jgi:hypothetical protein
MHLLSAASDSIALALTYPRFIRLFKLDEGVRIALHVLDLQIPPHKEHTGDFCTGSSASLELKQFGRLNR